MVAAIQSQFSSTTSTTIALLRDLLKLFSNDLEYNIKFFNSDFTTARPNRASRSWVPVPPSKQPTMFTAGKDSASIQGESPLYSLIVSISYCDS